MYEIKKEKSAWVFLLIHKFWSVLLEQFIERKPLILIWRVTHFFGPWKSVTNWMVTYIYKIISMKWVSDGQRPKTCRGCGWIFFFIPDATNYDADLDRKGLFFNCEKRACKSKKCQKCCHFFGEKSPKISDRHINNRLYNYEKVQNLISFSIIT